MAPEQVRGLPVDSRADIFAFGTVLYEMVSGRRAFRRDTAAETMTAILKEDPPDLSEMERPISPGLERIVRRCLEKQPEQRFQLPHYRLQANAASARRRVGPDHICSAGIASFAPYGLAK
jgi:serine/threonine protein kinase